MKFQSHQPERAQMQLAPMIDIVFLLLIFFIVTWQFSRSETDMRVSVPASTEGAEPDRQLGEIVVNVRKGGEVLVGGQTLNREELHDRLAAVARVHENQPIRLRGDADATYQTIVEVIDVCRRAGIWNISFATQRPEND